jgi:PelA/Pel-15E family pectate lyase
MSHTVPLRVSPRFLLRQLCAALFISLSVGGCALFDTRPAQPGVSSGPYQAISLKGMSDSIQHWRNRYGDNYAKYSEDQIVQIADNVLLYQRDNGGWVENRDPSRILNADEIKAITAEKGNETGSFDNRNVYSQIEYLSAVYLQTGDTRYRDAALHGIDYTLSMQHKSCGGWPHTVPGTERYHPFITMADEVTSGVLRTLRKVSDGSEPFGWTSASTRRASAAALKKGDECVLRLQVRQNGKLAGWAGQYDPVTLQPAMGRSFELASMVSQESVEMVRYLMGIPDPSPAQIAAIEGAIDWFQRSAITGWKIETFKIDPPIKYEYHTASTDRRLVQDANAPRMWGRFYDINDNSVVLANRDSVRVKQYSEITHERRTGYGWYGLWPEKLLSVEYPAWQERMRAKR